MQEFSIKQVVWNNLFGKGRSGFSPEYLSGSATDINNQGVGLIVWVTDRKKKFTQLVNEQTVESIETKWEISSMSYQN